MEVNRETRRPWEEPASKARKKLLLRTWLVAAAVMSLAVIILYPALVSSGDRRYDALYDDLEALAGPGCFTAEMSSTHHWGNTWKGSIGKLSGVYILFSCKVDEDTWGEMDYTLEATQGKAKLILADPAGNVTTIRECLAGETVQETVNLPLPAGTSSVKLVGTERAALSWQVEMN